MFHRQRDASKVALVALVELMRDDGRDGVGRLIDVQWITPHFASLGAAEISRGEYLARLERALALPLPAAFGGGGLKRHRGLTSAASGGFAPAPATACAARAPACGPA